MSAQELGKIWIYRIIHIDNLEYILNNGMFYKNAEKADVNYINIGDNALIRQRNEYSVGINPPNGFLGEYVPFYFGPLSPMLYNIKTGYRGVPQRSQADIIYLCCNIETIISNCESWCFTDGHAKNAITTFYNNINDIHNVDLKLASEKFWVNNDEDFDRMRKKQAEFLVKYHVPSSCIGNIVVYNEEAYNKVITPIERLKLAIKVHINPKSRFYY